MLCVTVPPAPPRRRGDR